MALDPLVYLTLIRDKRMPTYLALKSDGYWFVFILTILPLLVDVV